MKHLRITAEIHQDPAPTFYSILSASPGIRETHVLEWNTTVEDIDTVLFAINGDTEPFVDAAPDITGIESIYLSATDQRWTYILAEMKPQVTPIFDTIREARARPGLIVRKPIVYCGGDMHFRVVGNSKALQNALDEAPEAMEIHTKEIETFRGNPQYPTTSLSERQREAVEIALELGYYNCPRGTTHTEIADELGCTPQTASEHLQKAEAKLVRATMEEDIRYCCR